MYSRLKPLVPIVSIMIAVALVALTAACGVPQKDFDTLKMQLTAAEQETVNLGQQLTAKEDTAKALQSQLAAKDKHEADLHNQLAASEKNLQAIKEKTRILDSEIGFLAYWHQVPGDPERRGTSTSIVAELERRTGLPGYLASHMPIDTWWDGITYLESKGVKYILVIYMDDQPTYGSTLTDVIQWMLDLPGGRPVGTNNPNGWGAEAPHPSKPEKYGNIVNYMGTQHIKVKTFSDSVFIMTTAPTDPGGVAIDAFERQIRAVMKDPANTSVMLVDHGAAVEEVNSRWLAYRQKQADELKSRLGLKRASAFAIREDWPNLWPSSVSSMIVTAGEWSKDSTVIHVPVRESGIAGGGSSRQIEAQFKNFSAAPWVFAPAIMEIEANKESLVAWAADTLAKAASWVRETKPTANTYYGRSEKGIEGGILLGTAETHQH